MNLEKGVFALFPKIKKSAKLGPHSSRRVHASVSQLLITVLVSGSGS